MRLSLLLFLPALLASPLTVAAQAPSASLQNGSSLEKPLSSGQTHGYTLRLEKDEYVQVTVEQRSIDVIVRVFLPDGQFLKKFDSPNGEDGLEYVEIVTDVAGTYRIEVSPLAEDSGPGSYEIKVAELRKATDEELRSHRNESARKAKGSALLIETSEQLNQIRVAETRVDLQVRAALMLWESDQKRALALMKQAMETVRQLAADVPQDEDGEFDDYQGIMKMRQQIIHAIAPRDPEAAVKFMQSTRLQSESATRYGDGDPEVQLEMQLINQIVDTDPKRAFELTEDLLKGGLSYQLLSPLNGLAAKEPELAQRLAHDIMRKIISQDLRKDSTAAYLLGSLIQVVKSAGTSKAQQEDGESHHALLSKEDLGDLFQKIFNEVLSYSPGTNPMYGPEYGVMRTLATTLRQLPDDTRTYAGTRAEAVEKKVNELLGSPETAVYDWQKYQTAINNDPLENALQTIADAPEPMRDSLYQQVANKIATSGELARARQIISERVKSPTQRQMALENLKQQAVTLAATKGRFDEALTLLSKFRRDDRHELLSQVLDQMGPGVKRTQALQYLEQARNLIGSSARAENQQQMQSLLVIARKLGPYDVNRAFETVAPLLDQFNELSGAAVTMSGFDKDYYQDGELVLSGDNCVANIADDLGDTLATLAMFDFDRAKRATEGINRPEVRLRISLLIAERCMEVEIDADAPEGYGYNQ
jgi:hypothetical protein